MHVLFLQENRSQYVEYKGQFAGKPQGQITVFDNISRNCDLTPVYGNCDLTPVYDVVTWERPQRPKWMDGPTYQTMPETLVMRECRVGGRTLITTLTDARATPKPALAELYAMRWHVELDLRAIKTVMQMDCLRCKTPMMVEKEIAAHLLAYNLVRAVMAQAACLNNLLPRQLSFKTALQLLNAFEMTLRHGSPQRLAVRCAQLLTGLGRRRLPHRPHRVEPRAVKRRPKQHWLLTKPRHVLRARLLRLQARRMEATLS